MNMSNMDILRLSKVIDYLKREQFYSFIIMFSVLPKVTVS